MVRLSQTIARMGPRKGNTLQKKKEKEEFLFNLHRTNFLPLAVRGVGKKKEKKVIRGEKRGKEKRNRSREKLLRSLLFPPTGRKERI